MLSACLCCQALHSSCAAMDKSLVNKATSADDQPTPGYMYNEIARITHASAEASKQLEEYLIKRLKKDNVHQKLKCLKVISACAKMGHATFRRDMTRQTGEIKLCLGASASRACNQPPPPPTPHPGAVSRALCTRHTHGPRARALHELVGLRAHSLARSAGPAARRRLEQGGPRHGAGVHQCHLRLQHPERPAAVQRPHAGLRPVVRGWRGWWIEQFNRRDRQCRYARRSGH